MTLSEFCIRRPVFTWAVTFILVIIGIVAYHRLSVRDLPDVSNPLVVIRTAYPGADAKLIETTITTPLEDAISGVNGIDYINSKSDEGSSRIFVWFKPQYDINIAVNDVRDKVSGIILPPTVTQPVISKADDQDDPTLVLSVLAPDLTPMQITDYVERYIEPELEQIEGVNTVETWGARDYAMRIDLNPTRMAAHGIAVNDILDGLQAQNVYVPGGLLKSFSRYYPMTAEANLYTVQDFRNLVINTQDNYVTHLGDIADVNIGPLNTDSAFRINSKPAVAIGIIADSTANPIEVSQAIQKELAHIRQTLSPKMTIGVLYDNSEFINASLNEVYRAIFEALLLVTVVIFLFLGSWRSTIVPTVTIPICLIATFAVLYFFNYSINTITLLAFVLAIGLVVDDAIVMLENIHRYIEKGLSPFQAAISGSKEIIFAIIAMTLTLAAVYLPTGFTAGLTGILFSQFAVTLAGAVLISGFVALTLSPMMVAYILPQHKTENRYTLWLDKTLLRLTSGYKGVLFKVLQYRLWVVIALILLGISGYALYRSMPSELAPVEDQGYIYGIIQAPSQSSFEYTNHYSKMAESLYEKNPDIANSFTFIGNGGDPTQVFSIAILKPFDERKHTQQMITEQLQQQMSQIPGVRAFPVVPAPLGQHTSTHTGIEIKILSAETLSQTIDIANHFINVISKYPGLTNVVNQTTLDSNIINLKVNRDLAADLQVNVSDITNAIATLYGGISGNQYFQYDGQQYSVVVQLPEQDLRKLSQLNDVYIRSENKKMIPLSTLVTVDTEVGSEEFPHYNRLRVATVTAEIAPGYNMGQVVDYLQYVGKQALPNNAQYAFGGALKQFLATQSDIAGIFIFALIFIYLVLAAQFESIVDPFIVLLSVPFSIFGGLVFLKLAGGSLNIFSQIGMITLIGLIAKHGILITEFANQQQKQGKDVIPAVIDAAALRLRPILMTTGAMVLGAVPLALASGPGSETREAIGWVIVGGMLLGTFFSLFVVPVAYSYLSSLKQLARKS